jgi:hypothetical protein
MTLLTPGEFDNLPLTVQAELRSITQQPQRDHKDMKYRKKRGAYMNGDTYADPKVREVIGYGTGSPFAPHISDIDGGGPASPTSPETSPLDLGNVAFNQSPQG